MTALYTEYVVVTGTCSPDVTGVYKVYPAAADMEAVRSDGAYYIYWDTGEGTFVIATDMTGTTVKFGSSLVEFYGVYDDAKAPATGAPVVRGLQPGLSHEGTKLFSERGV